MRVKKTRGLKGKEKGRIKKIIYLTPPPLLNAKIFFLFFLKYFYEFRFPWRKN